MEIPADSDSNMEENNWDKNDEEGVEDTFCNIHNAADDMKDVSSDPFGLNGLIKRTTKDNILVKENEPDYPSGFTPMGNCSNTKNEKRNTLNVGGEEQIPSKDNDVNEVFNSIEESHNGKDDQTNSILEGFSMLDKFNDVIGFGQAMGFDMKGCEKDLKYIIARMGGMNDD
ncbi:hypothetical protein Tco_0498900 [Tanacetum coccineum]